MKPQRQIMSRIPLRGMGPEQWGLVIQTELVTIWIESMTPAEIQAYAEASEKGRLEQVPAGLFMKLDQIILDQASTVGWRITLSELVRFRMSTWDMSPDGPEKFEQLGLAMKHSALILQREELPPITDPDQWAVREETVQELRRVLEQMRASFSRVRRAPTDAQVFELFSSTVTQSQSFPHLASNLDRWRKFFEQSPECLRPIALGDRAQPAQLYNEFFSWSSGWKIESAR